MEHTKTDSELRRKLSLLYLAAPESVVDDVKETAERVLEEHNRMRMALEEIKQWAEAYPVRSFPEPDFRQAARALAKEGMTLDAISASNMRHTLSGAWRIAHEALK